MSIAGNGEDCNGVGREKERRRGEREAKETGAEILTYKLSWSCYYILVINVVLHVFVCA